MKNSTNYSKLVKKFDPYITSARSYSDIHSFRRKLTPKISNSESSPQKPSKIPNFDIQATIKNPNQPFKSIFLYKTSSTPELNTDSTMSSNNRQKVSIDPKVEAKAEPNARQSQPQKKFFIKPSRSLYRKTPTQSSEEIIQDYFAGIEFPCSVRNKAQLCALEYWLDVCRNSVNAIVGEGDVLFTGDASGEVRKWILPQQVDGIYYAKSYPKGTILKSSHLIYKSPKPIQTLEKIGKHVLIGGRDGTVKLFKLNKICHSLKFCAGLSIIKKLSIERFLVAGSYLEFIDFTTFSPFRAPVAVPVVLSLANQTNFTFLTGNEDSSIHLWDIRTPRSIRSFLNHRGPVTGVTMSSGFTFLSCSDDCTLREWDLRTGDEVYCRKSEEKLKGILVKNDFILTGGKFQTIWTKDGFEKIQFHEGSIKTMHLVNDFCFSGGYDGAVSCISFAYFN